MSLTRSSEAFLQPQARAVQERHDDPRDPIKLLHDARDLVVAQDDRDADRHARTRYVLDGTDFNAKYVAIQEQERTERLILRRRADSAIRCEPGEEGGDLRGAHVRRMPLPMKDDVSPTDRLLSSQERVLTSLDNH